LQFSCHAKSDWKITGFQAFPHFIATHYALLQSGVAEAPPRLGALFSQSRTCAPANPVPLRKQHEVCIAVRLIANNPGHCANNPPTPAM
jgi:hypothetical protein